MQSTRPDLLQLLIVAAAPRVLGAAVGWPRAPAGPQRSCGSLRDSARRMPLDGPGRSAQPDE